MPAQVSSETKVQFLDFASAIKYLYIITIMGIAFNMIVQNFGNSSTFRIPGVDIEIKKLRMESDFLMDKCDMILEKQMNTTTSIIESLK